jgi:hypothetical protein
MSWVEADKKAMITAVDVLSLVPQRAGIPSSDFVRVLTKKNAIEMSLSSTVTGVVRVPLTDTLTPGPFFVDKGLFTAYIQAGKSWKGNFKMALTEDKWLIRQGSRKADFSMRKEPVSGYGVWRDRDKSKEIKLSEGLRKLLLASNHCSTADPALPHLNCVYIGGKLVLSTNLISLFVGVRDQEDALRIPFPVGIIPLLGDSLVQAVGVENDRVMLDCGCGFIEGTISAVAQKSFPKKDVVEKIQKGRTWPLLTRLPAEKLSKMLARLASYLGGVKREDWIVEMAIDQGVVKASVRVQQGKFEEQMEIENGTVEGTIRWPLELALAVVDYMAQNGEWIKVRVDEQKNTPYLLSGGGVEMMVARQIGK